MNKLICVTLISILLPIQALGGNDRDLVAFSAASGGILGGVGGFWGETGLEILCGGDASGLGGLLIGAPLGFVGGTYLATSIAKDHSNANDVSIHKVVLGNTLGTLAVAPLMLYFSADERITKHDSLALTLIFATGLAGAYAGSRIGANELSVNFPVIRF